MRSILYLACILALAGCDQAKKSEKPTDVIANPYNTDRMPKEFKNPGGTFTEKGYIVDHPQNWLIVQYDWSLRAERCWTLRQVTQISMSWGSYIQFTDPADNRSYVVNGWWNADTAPDGNFTAAAAKLDVDLNHCLVKTK